MFIYSEKTITSEVVDGIRCDKCGKDIDMIKDDYFYGEKLWGYNSRKDDTKITFHLCEDCFDEIEDTFKYHNYIFMV